MKKLLIVIAFCSAIIPGASALDTAKIDNITGLKGTLNEKEGVYRIGFSRSDVAVAVDGSKMPPFMGLGTWAAFTQSAHTEAMVMGDTVLFEDEVNPVMSAAFDSGLSVTALHNHFFFGRFWPPACPVQVHRRRIKAAAAAAELVNFHLRSASETFLAIVIAVAGSRLAVGRTR